MGAGLVAGNYRLLDYMVFRERECAKIAVGGDVDAPLPPHLDTLVHEVRRF